VSAALLLAAITGASGCASRARPQPFPVPSPPGTAATPAIDGTSHPLDGYAIATTALAFQGTPYRSGGADPTGFDCSGLVQYVLGRYGLAWPRVVRDQFAVGTRVSLDDIQPGDLVFFATESREVSHVGIAIGGDRFVHAPNSKGVVRVESLGSEYWSRHFAGARRIY
jgi:cell wall-associated NlpC family hydrolase